MRDLAPGAPGIFLAADFLLRTTWRRDSGSDGIAGISHFRLKQTNHRKCRSYRAKLSVGMFAGQSTAYEAATITSDRGKAEMEFRYDQCCFRTHGDAPQDDSHAVCGLGCHTDRFTCVRDADFAP
jgi:hypothetical protein